MAAAAPSPLASSAEKTNGAKLSRLLIDGGTTVLRNVFDRYHPPAKLAADLNANYLTLDNLLRKRVLRPAQWDQLFPPGRAIPDSKTFDITLLFLLLTNICGLSSPLLGWHIKPSPSDTSFEANLARVRFFRNELYGHVTSTGVDTPSFNGLWQEISAVLVALGLDQAEVDRLKAERCGEDVYLDVLLDWADSEQEIKTQLKEIRHELHMIDIDTKKALSETRQTQLEDRKILQESVVKLEGISQTQTETRQAVGEVHETLEVRLEEVKQEVENLKKRMEIDSAEGLLRNLAMSEFKGDIEYHAQRFQEGTREWIFKRVEDWLDDRSSPNRVMVISGSAGMGKSVISSVICKKMQEAGRLSGSHFCQHNNVRYRNPRLMLQSLASHLSQALPEYRNALVDQLSRNLGPVELNNMGLEGLFALLFKEPLSKIADPGRNLLVVIDGLDESEYQGRNELLDVIVNQFCKLPQWLRFFVTSRSEIDIAKSLKHFHPIQLEENQDENSRDIQLFFEMQLSHEIEQEDKVVLLRSLVEKSEGVFLYAYFLTDFIKKNVSLLKLEQLESSLPLGISSVYLSHFKRLKKEISEELKIDEDQMLSFLCAVTASREPLPVAFVSRLLNLSGVSSFSIQGKINKVIACISSFLPVRDGRLHFFHKSVKDWLTNTSCYDGHDFTMDEKKGHEILFELCRCELDNIKKKGVQDTQFSDTEKYALRHGVQHMIEVDKLGEKLRPCSIEELPCMYVTDLELIYAKLCVNSTSAAEDIRSVQKNPKSALFNEQNQSLLVSLLTLLRKHAYLLTDHPHLWFQSVINEGSPELSSRAATILENCLPSVPYMKYVDKDEHKGAVQTRFYCSDTVACFDVSPEMDYMVCECRDGTIHLWCLETGKKEWKRPSLVKRNYESVHPNGQMFCDEGAYREILGASWHTTCTHRTFPVLTFYRSVVFHPSGKSVLPGTLRKAYTLKGDCNNLFPNSNCTFSHGVFPKNKRTILTDCVDDPKAIVLWSMENGEQLMRRTWNYVISSFAISQDGSHIAVGDVTGYIHLFDVNRLDGHGLFKCRDASCGLMYFTPDNKNLVCGYLHYGIEDLGHRYGWTQACFGKPLCFLLQLDSVSISGDCAWIGPTDFVLWPIEPIDVADGFFSSWVTEVGSVFPSLETGFFKKLNNESALVGSPPFTYVAAVNVDLLNKANSASTKQVVTEVVFSSEGDAIYSISRDERSSQRTNEVLVTVLRMSSQELLKKKTFTDPLLSLEAMREGVILCFKHRVPELWDFELTECVRPLVRLKGTEKFIRLSDELIACQLPRRRITHDELLNFGHSSEVVVENSWELHVQDDRGWQGESFDSYGISNKGDSSVLEDDSSDLKIVGDLRDLKSFEYFRMLAVDIINVTSGECVSSVKTRVCRDDRIPFILCNRQNQLLVCTSEEKDDDIFDVFDIEQLTVSLRNSNSLKPVWEKSTKRYDGHSFTPEFIFSPGEEFLITWGSFVSASGLHILEAKSGETRHTLLKDQENIADCKFVGNCDTLVCCSRDNFLRLFNVPSGELLSQLDIEEQPYRLGACMGNFLVAVGLSAGARLKFIHAELRRDKDNGMKKGSIVKDK